MEKFSPQTKSLLVLLSLAVLGTYLCLMLWTDMGSGSYRLPVASKNQDKSVTIPAADLFNNKVDPVDTSAWKTYADRDSGLSFKYKPEWSVKDAKIQNGFRIIEVDPGKKYFNIKIYISPSGFYALDGLPTTEETINGHSAINVKNMLYGIKAGQQYFTFDVGASVSLTQDFNALVHSAEFAN